MASIVSFYSYKGGVGRTQLAANLAAYLCYHRGRKVLLVEWDLEAPGLHYYFGKENDFVQGTGLIEMLEEYVKLMRSNETNPEKLPKITKENILSLNDKPKPYMGKNDINREGKIDLFPAGKYDEGFSKRITDFNWEEFKTSLDGNMYIAMLREQLKNLDYDYVFIDSRTGISDYSGYCTILLPDVNVFVIAPNSQNYKGSEKIARNILAHSYIKAGNRKPYMLPILSRLDKNAANAQSKIEEFDATFNFLLNTWDKEIDSEILPLLFEEYSNKTLLEYNANIAVGENLLFNNKKETKIGQQNFEHVANAFLEKFCEQEIIDFQQNIEAETWFDWGYDFRENKKYTQAIICYRKATEIKLNYYEAWNNLGIVYRRISDYNQAINCYQKAIEIKTDNYHAWYNLGIVYRRISDYNQAINCYQKAIEIKPDHYQAWYNLGVTYAKIEDYTQAIICYQKAIEIKPDYDTAWSNLGVAYDNIKDYSQAIICYQKAIEIKPDKDEAWNNLGTAYFHIKDYSQAITCYQKAIEIKPDYDTAWSNLGITYAKIEDYNQAITCYRKAIDIQPDYDAAWNNLGSTYDEIEDYSQAIICYQKAIEIKPDKDEAWYNLGLAYFNIEDYAQAITCYQKAIEMNPDFHEAWYNLGIAYNEIEDYSQAITCYQKAVEIKPDSHESWNNLGSAYNDIEDYTQAITCYQKAIEIKPDYHEAWSNLGFVYFIQGKFLEAEKYLLQTIFLDNSVMNLGHIRLSEQKPQEALVLYRQSLAMFTDKNEFSKDMQDDFKYLQAHGVGEEQYQGIIAELQKVE